MAGKWRPRNYADEGRSDPLHELGDRKIGELTHADVEALVGAMRETPIAANRTLALVNTLVRYALRMGWRVDPQNPCAGIQKYPESSRVVNLPRENLDRLHAALTAPGRRHASANAIMLLILTGARRNEVLGARWPEFDLQRGVWTRPAERLKQKTTSVIPLNDVALALLREMRAADGKSQWLFPNAKGSAPQRGLKKFWRNTCAAAGIDGLRVHDLRHVFASAMLEHGAPIAAIGSLLGHANTVMTRRYAHLSDRALREASNVAGRVLGAFHREPRHTGVSLRPRGQR